MIVEPTVLILGAGASAPYGLPVGTEFRRLILGMSDTDMQRLPAAPGAGFDPYLLKSFREEFARSRYYSIDAFLARRQEFLPIGRAAIAAVLLPKERLGTLVESDRDDDWLQYVLHAMDAPWEELGHNRIAFITFNYDRSLETCLVHATRSRYGTTPEETLTALAQFPIVHVYGSLGSILPHEQTYVPYGIDPVNDWEWRQAVGRAAGGVKIVAEGRDDSPELRQARDLISSAQRLAFLGFAFDPINVERLGGQGISASGRMVGTTSFQGLRFAATGYGLTAAERAAAARRISHPQAIGATESAIKDLRCPQLLRESLILGD